MAVYCVGQTVRVTASFTNAAGGAANPTTTTFRSKSPSGTKTSENQADPDVANPATGTYRRDYALSESGTWWFRVESTGDPATAAETSIEVLVSEF